MSDDESSEDDRPPSRCRVDTPSDENEPRQIRLQDVNLLGMAPDPETIHEAHGLYLLTLTDEMRRLGVNIAQLDPHVYTCRPSYANIQRIRALAARFAHSPQREYVHFSAQSVDLDSLNYERFQCLLYGLFEQGGVTWERVLVLFYFCTDLSIRVFQEKLVINHFLDIYNWTVCFLNGTFSTWVDVHGGWSVVLHRSANYLLGSTVVIGCCLVLAFAYWYLKRK